VTIAVDKEMGPPANDADGPCGFICSEAYTQFTSSPVTGFDRDLTGGSVCLRVKVGLRPTHSCS